MLLLHVRGSLSRDLHPRTQQVSGGPWFIGFSLYLNCCRFVSSNRMSKSRFDLASIAMFESLSRNNCHGVSSSQRVNHPKYKKNVFVLEIILTIFKGNSATIRPPPFFNLFAYSSTNKKVNQNQAIQSVTELHPQTLDWSPLQPFKRVTKFHEHHLTKRSHSLTRRFGSFRKKLGGPSWQLTNLGKLLWFLDLNDQAFFGRIFPYGSCGLPLPSVWEIFPRRRSL